LLQILQNYSKENNLANQIAWGVRTLRSKGSPLNTPSMLVSEWHVAIPIMNKGGSSLELEEDALPIG